jgi:hypothetical protein
VDENAARARAASERGYNPHSAATDKQHGPPAFIHGFAQQHAVGVYEIKEEFLRAH